MLLTLVFLLVLGLLLLFLELFVVPGVTFVGIAGTIFLGVAIFYIFAIYGAVTGWLSVAAISLFSAFVIVRSIRSRFWTKFSLKEAIDSKVNVVAAGEITVGMEGVTVSALRPMGSARFQGKLYEVQVEDGLIDSGQAVVVVGYVDQKIIVKPL